MNLRILILVLLYLIDGKAILGQSIRVMDKDLQSPLPYVTVRGEKHNGITDLNGEINLSSFNDGKIEFSLIGFADFYYYLRSPRTDKDTIYLSQIDQLLEEITVSASRWAESSARNPIKVSALGRDAVFKGSTQTSADLLTNTGHVFVQKSQLGGGSPVIRGFSTSRILIAVDGVRMNNAIFRGGNLQNVLSIDPFTIGRTEVTYGPGGVLYGSDAIGGVMNFYTLKPTINAESGHIGGNIFSRYASANDERTFHGDLTWNNGKWAGITSVTHSDFGDLRMGRNGPEEYLNTFYVVREDDTDIEVINDDPLNQIPTAYSQISLFQKISFQASSSAIWNYSIYFSETSDIPRYDRSILRRNGLPRYGRWDYGPQQWFFQNFSGNLSLNNSWADDAQLIFGHQKYSESRITRNFNETLESQRQEVVDILSLNLDLRKEFERWHFYYGGEMVLNFVDSRGESVDVLNGEIDLINSRYPGSTWSSLATYFVSEYQVGKDWVLQGGLRFNSFDLDADFRNSILPLPFVEANLNTSTLTGNLGSVLRLDTHWKWKGSIATGTRAPNVDDVGKIFDSAPGRVVVPNPDLSPETAYNAESTLSFLSTKFNFDGTLYFTYLKDAMVRRNSLFNGRDSILYDGELSQVQSIQNAADTKIFGLQLSANFRISEQLNLKGYYNFQSGTTTEESNQISRPRHAVPNYGSLNLTYNQDSWSVKLESQWQASLNAEDLPLSERDKPNLYAQDESGNPYAPSWIVLNTTFNFNLSDSWVINVGIDNLLDRRYRPYSSGITAPGRNLYGSVKIKW